MKRLLELASAFSLAVLTPVVWAQETPAPAEKPEASPSAPPESVPDEAAAEESTKAAGSEEAPAEGAEDAEGETEATEGEAPAVEQEASPQEEAGPAEGEEAVEDAGTEEEEPAEGEEPPEVQKKSVTSNQQTEIPPDDDYDGATDDALVEKDEPKNLSLGIALDVTWPLGDAASFIDNASIQGLSLDLRYYAWGNIGIGAGVALDSLSKKTTGTVDWENATLTGTQVRELSYTPLTIKGYYAWRDQERFIPYVAAGLGAARAVRRLVVGFSSLSEDSWHFAVVPEAGLQIPAGPTVLLTNVRLNYLPASAGVADQVFANFSFGLSIQ